MNYETRQVFNSAKIYLINKIRDHILRHVIAGDFLTSSYVFYYLQPMDQIPFQYGISFMIYKKKIIPGIWPEKSGSWLNFPLGFDQYLWTRSRIYPQPSRGRP